MKKSIVAILCGLSLVVGVGAVLVFRPQPLPVVVTVKTEQAEQSLGGGGNNFNSFSAPLTSTTLKLVNTSTAILPDEYGRIYGLFINDNDVATQTIYLHLGTASTTASGYTVRINGAGGSYELNTESMYTGPIYASSSVANSRLLITDHVQ